MQSDPFTLLADNSPLACFVYDLTNARFNYVNAAFVTLFEVEPDKLTIETIIQRVPEKELNYIRKVYKAFLHGEAHKEIELRIVTASEKEKWINIIPNNIQQEGEIVSGYIKDVTAERSSVESIRKYANKKNSVLTILAHDLTGPMAVAQNIIVLLDKKVEDPDLKKLINNIAKTNKQSIQLINDLIQRELIDTTDAILFKKRVNVVSKLKEMIEEFKNSEDTSGRSFSFRASSESILLDLDEPKFIQIINNLMSNALKFTHINGSIGVIIEEQAESVLFTFSDDGIGIPGKFHERLFEKFTPARRTGLQGEPTIGLGLAIIKTIIEWHSGRIWFTSKENEGTTFYFEIPYQP